MKTLFFIVTASAALLLTLVLTPACPPPAPPAVIDASDAMCINCGVDAANEAAVKLDAAPSPPSTSDCVAACAALAKVGCLEGVRYSCPAAMQEINDHQYLHNKDGGATTCVDVARVTTAAGALASGVGCALPDGG